MGKKNNNNNNSCSHSTILSTGILRRFSNTVFLTVEAMNVDPNDYRTVTVQMFDWSSGAAVALALLDPSTKTLPPNSVTSFRSEALLGATYLYEVRIIHPADTDVVTNVFGLSSFPFDPQVGNNVIQHDLAVLKLK